MKLVPVGDLLVPYDRPVRRNLRAWADELAAELGARPPPHEGASLLNNAALVFAHLGRRELARSVSTGHLRWVAALASHEPATLGLALQPWVNLGRLDALDGRHAEARAHFTLFESVRAEEPVEIGPCRVEGRDWRGIARDDADLTRVLSNVYVIDSLKAWFAETDYSSALDFVARARLRATPTPSVTFHEAEVVCHLGLGDPMRALEVASSWEHVEPYMAAVDGLHLVPALVAVGDRAGAADCARQLMRVSEWARSTAEGGARRTALLRFLERHANTLVALDLRDDAIAVTVALLDEAGALGDEVSKHHGLDLLAALLPPGPERRRRVTEKAALETSCDYAVVGARAGGRRADVGRPSYERLAAAISTYLTHKPTSARDRAGGSADRDRRRAYVADVQAYYDRTNEAYLSDLGTTLQVAIVDAGGRDVVRGSNVFLAAAAGIGPGQRVLDAGCGVCGPSIDIATSIPGVTIDAITVSAAQAAAASELVRGAGLGSRLRVIRGDYHELPFRSLAFDTVVFFESSGYAYDGDVLWREVHRVLRPGGTLYIKDVFSHDSALLPEQERELAEFDRVYVHRTPSMTDVVERLERSGFDVLRARNLRAYEEAPEADVEVDTGARYLSSLLTTGDGGAELSTLGTFNFRPWRHLPIFFGEIRARRPGA